MVGRTAPVVGLKPTMPYPDYATTSSWFYCVPWSTLPRRLPRESPQKNEIPRDSLSWAPGDLSGDSLGILLGRFDWGLRATFYIIEISKYKFIYWYLLSWACVYIFFSYNTDTKCEFQLILSTITFLFLYPTKLKRKVKEKNKLLANNRALVNLFSVFYCIIIEEEAVAFERTVEQLNIKEINHCWNV